MAGTLSLFGPLPGTIPPELNIAPIPVWRVISSINWGPFGISPVSLVSVGVTVPSSSFSFCFSRSASFWFIDVIAPMAASADAATTAVVIGLPIASVPNPFNILGISLAIFSVNPPTKPIILVINPPRPRLNARKTARNAGHVTLKKSCMAFIFC